MKLNFDLWISAILVLVAGVWMQRLPAQDSAQAKWTATGSLHEGRVYHTATLLPNGQVLIVGGHGVSDDLASAELYDPDKGVFVKVADMSTGRAAHTATLLQNGQVLVVGGQFHGSTLRSAELYNPATGTWKNTGNLHLARSYHTATLLPNGQVLVVGGCHLASPPVYTQGAPPGSALDIAELYDPYTEKWTVTDNLHAARYAHTATLLPNGQVLVTGGIGAQGANDALSSSELYNPTTKSWTTTHNLFNTLYNQSAILLPNGQVLVFGGQYQENKVVGASLYESTSGTWTQTGNLPIAVSGLTATLLPDGRVLAAGGGLVSGVSANAELYNPATGTWETTVGMSTARGLPTATLLRNGQVLVTGGGNGDGLPSGILASAELYSSGAETSQESSQKATTSEITHYFPARADSATTSLLNLATCLVIFTGCLVILTACVVLLLASWLVFVLIRRFRK